MCESCGPSEIRPVNPELMKRFRETLNQRGVTAEMVDEPSCHGTPTQKFWERVKEFLFNMKILFGSA